MRIISDLHIHGKFSRATSKELTIPNLEKYARLKGINLLGTGDFTHPGWIQHIKEELTEDGSGILKTKTNFPFMLQTEISLMYTQGKGRRIHNVVLAPSIEVANQITEYLKKHGRVDYDGRPIFKISCIEFAENLMSISQDIEIIPAHAWTPWFGIFGSATGFDSVEEAFGDKAKHIHAIETGLSSDPPMNWRLSKLDKYNLVSFSDLHSFWPWRVGREATILELKDVTYKRIINAIRTGRGLHGTIEVDPAYGKYHWDGHRNCNISMSPAETKKHKGICPVCKKKLTIGVEYRVEELADRPQNYLPQNHKEYYKLIPLSEILANLYQKGIATRSIWQEYYKFVTKERSEFDILINMSQEELNKIMDPKLVNIIMRNRRGEIKVIPGYDGVYGVPVFNKSDKSQPIKLEKHPQRSLGDF